MPLDAAQLELRKGRITGSQVAAVVGLSPWSDPYDAWMKIMGYSEYVETEYARWGQALEPVILNRYADENEVALEYPVPTIVHPEQPWACVTPDALVIDLKRNVEAKTTGYRHRGRWKEDEIPQEYLIQIHWEMWVLDFTHTDVVVLIGGQDYRVYRFDRDHMLERVLVERAYEWWNRHVLTRTPPPMDGSDGATRFLQKRFKKHSNALVKADGSAEQWIASLRQIKQWQRQLNEAQSHAENEIKARIGGMEGLESDHGIVKWKKRKNSPRTAWKQVALEAGASKELIDKHTMTKEGNRVLYTPRKWLED